MCVSTSSWRTPPPSTAPRVRPPAPATCVLGEHTSAASAYVAMTRGRDDNVAHLVADDPRGRPAAVGRGLRPRPGRPRPRRRRGPGRRGHRPVRPSTADLEPHWTTARRLGTSRQACACRALAPSAAAPPGRLGDLADDAELAGPRVQGDPATTEPPATHHGQRPPPRIPPVRIRPPERVNQEHRSLAPRPRTRPATRAPTPLRRSAIAPDPSSANGAYGYSRPDTRREASSRCTLATPLPSDGLARGMWSEPCGAGRLSGQLIARSALPGRLVDSYGVTVAADDRRRHPHDKENRHDRTPPTTARPHGRSRPHATTRCSPSAKSPTFVRVPSPPCATGATSAAGLAASRSAATSATGEPTSSSGSPSRPTVHCTPEQTGPCRSPGAS